MVCCGCLTTVNSLKLAKGICFASDIMLLLSF